MEKRVRPMLKWPGGKFRLLDAILPDLPEGERLVEPFVGSGAVFMNTRYPAYLLCDLNADLIEFYRALMERKGRFITKCREQFADGNVPEEYYRRRERFNKLKPGPERASLFLYFNRHGYNGLIRYNANGEFNVPFGRYAGPYFPEEEMRFFIEKTRHCHVELRCADYRDTFAELRPGDVVYCDPPYIPLSDTANFTNYAGNTFGPGEQAALAALVEKAAEEGVRLAVSNHAGGEARRLYKGARTIREFQVRRHISCNGGKRDKVDELLAVYP